MTEATEPKGCEGHGAGSTVEAKKNTRGFQDAYPKQRWKFLYELFYSFFWRMIFRLHVNSGRVDSSFIESFFDHWVFSIWWSITGDLLHHLLRSCYTSWPAIWLYDFLCLMPRAISWTILHGPSIPMNPHQSPLYTEGMNYGTIWWFKYIDREREREKQNEERKVT